MSDVNNLHILAQLTGETYRGYRDSVLSGRVDFSALEATPGMEDDWRLPVMIAILNGWTNRRERFVEVSRALQDAVPAGEGRPNAGGNALIWDDVEMMAHSEYGPDALPLAWEVIMKFHDTFDPQLVANHLAVISGVPDAASVDPVAGLIEASENRFLRDRAIYCLSRLPRAPAQAALARLEGRAEDLSSVVQAGRDLLR